MNRFLPQITLLALTGILSVTSCHRSHDVLPHTVSASPVSVGLSTNEVRVGDVFSMTLIADYPSTDSLLVPDIAQGKDLVVRNRQEKKQTLADGRVRTTIQYDLASFVLGDHTICTGAVQLVHHDGTSTSLPFPPAKFMVQSLLNKANTPWRDIKGLAHWPGIFPRWLIGILFISALAALAALFVYRFLTKPRTILQYSPPLPAHEIALNELRTLLSKNWIEAENVEPFYTELSSIMRRYLENRFGLRAPERTTEEFIREATTSRLLSPDHQGLTSNFLEQCDLVKFARHRPQRADMQNAYHAAERLVRETIPATTIDQTSSSTTPTP